MKRFSAAKILQYRAISHSFFFLLIYTESIYMGFACTKNMTSVILLVIAFIKSRT